MHCPNLEWHRFMTDCMKYNKTLENILRFFFFFPIYNINNNVNCISVKKCIFNFYCLKHGKTLNLKKCRHPVFMILDIV